MKILVVDDEKYIRKSYRSMLEKAGFDVCTSDSAEETLLLIEQESFDMIITDVSPPGIDGITLTRILRDSGYNLPVMIVSGHHTQKDIDAGLRAGADDYMSKPVEEEEFLLRIKAILRRAHICAEYKITLGSTIADSHTRTVTVEEHVIALPHKEFDLLFFLLSYPDQVFSREYLLNKLWGPDSESEPATISVHVNRLRKRFHDNPDFRIQTCRGYGYKICRL